MNDQVLSKARINAHKGVDGGRSQGDDGLNTDMGTSDTDGAEQRYSPKCGTHYLHLPVDQALFSFQLKSH